MTKPDEELIYLGALPQTPHLTSSLWARGGSAKWESTGKYAIRSLSRNHKNIFQLLLTWDTGCNVHQRTNLP